MTTKILEPCGHGNRDPIDQIRRLLAALPADMPTQARITAVVLALDAGTDGSTAIQVTDIMRCTGLNRRSQFRALAYLSRRGFITDAGWAVRGDGIKTRKRMVGSAA